MFVESKYILDYNRRVLTPFGYQRIECVHKTREVRTLKFTHERGEIIVAEFHTFIVNQEEISAYELYTKFTQGERVYLQDTNGLVLVTNIQSNGIQELYDITLDQSEFDNYWYYTNGILSHNSGKSVTVACYLAWLFNFSKDMNIGIVANRAAQAKEFLQNTKDIISRLPIWLMQGLRVWNKTEIGNELGMRILTDVPSQDSFRGYSIHCIHGKQPITVRDRVTKVTKNLPIEQVFQDLSEDVLVAETLVEVVSNNKYEILTETGFQDFLGVKRSINEGLEIHHERGVFKCTSKHQFKINGDFVLAEDLKVGDHIASNSKIININKDSTKEYYYDPIEVSNGNTYLSDNVNNHNCLVVDECAFIKTSVWEEFADSIFPAQSALAWKKSIIISTAKGLNHFHDIVQKAKVASLDPSSKSELVEVKWDEVPRYDSKGDLIAPEDFKSQIIKRYGRVYFEQNYGNSFVGSSETLIAPETLANLAPVKPIRHVYDMLRIFQEPQKDRIYVMGVDAAKQGKDYFAVQIVDVTSLPFMQVATANLQVDYLSMTDYLYDWGAMYNTCHIVIENNEGAGQSIADSLVNHLEYPNVYYDNFRLKYPGFRTTKNTRDGIIRFLQVLMNSNRLIVQDQATIKEFEKFELVNGKYQASSGHDDLVMSLAISLAPLYKLENLDNFGDFLKALKSTEVISTQELMDVGDLFFEDY